MATRYFLPRVFSTDGYYPLLRPDALNQLFNETFPWKIWQESNKEVDKLTKFLPKLDVLSDDKNYIVHVEIPGVNCDDVKVEVKNNLLVISGEKKNEKVEGDGKEQHVAERSWGSFYRELMLPEDAEVDNINLNFIFN